MSKEYIDKFIEFFEAVLARPLMYFGKYDDNAVFLFTYGLYMSLSITNQDFPNIDTHKEVCKNRGWHFNALGAVPDMRKKGLSDEEIVKELITIEIEAWKFFRDNFEK